MFLLQALSTVILCTSMNDQPNTLTARIDFDRLQVSVQGQMSDQKPIELILKDVGFASRIENKISFSGQAANQAEDHTSRSVFAVGGFLELSEAGDGTLDLDLKNLATPEWSTTRMNCIRN